MRPRLRSWMVVTGALAVGVAMGSIGGRFAPWATPQADAPRPAAPAAARAPVPADRTRGTDVRGVLDELSARLAEQDARQSALEREVEFLREALGEESPTLGMAELDAGNEDPSADEPATARDTTPSRRRFRERSVAERKAVLVESGMSEVDADRVIAAADKASLDRLSLRYQAAREGWLDSPEYRQAMAALPNERELVRREYGEDAYDRYLYASGRSNRVVVESVMGGSAAQQAGLQTGDTLVGLAGERVYSVRDLMRIATEGAADEMIPLTAVRNGALVETTVPRGPLGIGADHQSVDPASAP